MAYFLPDGYVERLDAPQTYDIGGDDTWQREVYETALKLSEALDLTTVLDFGCGSGFKLMKYFGINPKYTTIGVDLAPAVEILKRLYPNGWWSTAENLNCLPPGLLICSDVIEHVNDPGQLCSLFKYIGPRWLVISTPDRELMARHPKWTNRMGPPGNQCHVREWSFGEFRQFMDIHFDVVRHFHSNLDQCTQCCICRLKTP